MGTAEFFGVSTEMGAVLITKFARTLPLPTIRRQVSVRKSTIAKKTKKDAIQRNQKMAGQVHLIRSSPLIKGATLGGVFILLHKLLAMGGFSTIIGRISGPYKSERNPIKDPRLAGVVRSPRTPYAKENVPIQCLIKYKLISS